MRRILRPLGYAVLVSLAGAGTGLGAISGVGALRSSARPPQSADKAKVASGLGNVALSFVENRGQVAGPARYYVQGRDTSVFFANDGVTYSLSRPGSSKAASSAALTDGPTAAGGATQAAVKLDFVGARATEPTAGAPAPGVVSYFGSTPERSHTGLSTYGGVAYHDLWPGIDAVYSGTGSKLEYTFVVHPGADPSDIRLAYRGADGAQLNDKGQLEVSTAAGGFTDDRPTSYQDLDGTRVTVSSSWAANPADGSFGLPVGAYDASRDLVIDPVQFVYAGFIGGAREEEGHGIAVDNSGNAYVTGSTQSSPAQGFPATVGPSTTYTNNSGDFVAKVSADGTHLLYAGYLDSIATRAIAVDQWGAAYLTGSSSVYPPIAGPSTGGGTNAVVVKVDPDGTHLDYAGSIGGTASDDGYAIAVDAAGNAYVGGDTSSPDFPVSVGPDLTYNGGLSDAFVAKVNPAGSGLDYAGYIGGAGRDGANELAGGFGIAVDGRGAAYVTGITASGPDTFPVKVGPNLRFGGVVDTFVAKVKPSGRRLDYAGYIGGSEFDAAGNIDVDAAGNAYVAGWTNSPSWTFPGLVGPDLKRRGESDAFVVKINGAGTAFVYAGFVGGQGTDHARGIAVDGAGAAYIVGFTNSTHRANKGPDITFGGAIDGFVAKVKPAGTGFAYFSYIGGAGPDDAFGVAVDPTGNAYVTGYTASRETTFPAAVGPDLTLNEGPNPGCGPFGECRDAFVVKIASGP